MLSSFRENCVKQEALANIRIMIYVVMILKILFGHIFLCYCIQWGYLYDLPCFIFLIHLFYIERTIVDNLSGYRSLHLGGLQPKYGTGIPRITYTLHHFPAQDKCVVLYAT